MSGTITARLGAQGFTTRITADGHEMIADEPSSLGGEDLGATPYHFLLGALAGCTTITLRMYAKRKGWPLEEVVVTATHERVHADDCADCESTTGMVDRIDMKLELKGDLSNEQRSRLEAIAKRCPVHQTLTSETVIRAAP